MTVNAFGGRWTAQKLQVLRDYLGFFSKALKHQRFKLVYIDAFAGTGRCKVRLHGQPTTIEGSALIALGNDPPFDEYYFIEKNRRHRAELAQVLREHPTGQRGTIIDGQAQHEIEGVLGRQDWRQTRGVLFLDPFGLHLEWSTLERIAATQALDVFFLVSLSGLYRNATNDLANADADKREAVSRFLGTGTWMEDLYVDQGDLFGMDQRTRTASPEMFAEYVQRRLAEVFPTVLQPRLLYQVNAHGTRGAPLFALYFMVSNPSPQARALAARVGSEIMSQLR